MKINKTSLKIGCFVPGCTNLSTYSLAFGDNAENYYLCESCAQKLKKELEGIEKIKQKTK